MEYSEYHTPHYRSHKLPLPFDVPFILFPVLLPTHVPSVTLRPRFWPHFDTYIFIHYRHFHSCRCSIAFYCFRHLHFRSHSVRPPFTTVSLMRYPRHHHRYHFSGRVVPPFSLFCILLLIRSRVNTDAFTVWYRCRCVAVTDSPPISPPLFCFCFIHAIHLSTAPFAILPHYHLPFLLPPTWFSHCSTAIVLPVHHTCYCLYHTTYRPLVCFCFHHWVISLRWSFCLYLAFVHHFPVCLPVSCPFILYSPRCSPSFRWSCLILPPGVPTDTCRSTTFHIYHVSYGFYVHHSIPCYRGISCCWIPTLATVVPFSCVWNTVSLHHHISFIRWLRFSGRHHFCILPLFTAFHRLHTYRCVSPHRAIPPTLVTTVLHHAPQPRFLRSTPPTAVLTVHLCDYKTHTSFRLWNAHRLPFLPFTVVSVPFLTLRSTLGSSFPGFLLFWSDAFYRSATADHLYTVTWKRTLPSCRCHAFHRVTYHHSLPLRYRYHYCHTAIYHRLQTILRLPAFRPVFYHLYSHLPTARAFLPLIFDTFTSPWYHTSLFYSYHLTYLEAGISTTGLPWDCAIPTNHHSLHIIPPPHLPAFHIHIWDTFFDFFCLPPIRSCDLFPTYHSYVLRFISFMRRARRAAYRYWACIRCSGAFTIPRTTFVAPCITTCALHSFYISYSTLFCLFYLQFSAVYVDYRRFTYHHFVLPTHHRHCSTCSITLRFSWRFWILSLFIFVVLRPTRFVVLPFQWRLLHLFGLPIPRCSFHSTLPFHSTAIISTVYHSHRCSPLFGHVVPGSSIQFPVISFVHSVTMRSIYTVFPLIHVCNVTVTADSRWYTPYHSALRFLFHHCFTILQTVAFWVGALNTDLLLRDFYHTPFLPPHSTTTCLRYATPFPFSHRSSTHSTDSIRFGLPAFRYHFTVTTLPFYLPPTTDATTCLFDKLPPFCGGAFLHCSVHAISCHLPFLPPLFYLLFSPFDAAYFTTVVRLRAYLFDWATYATFHRYFISVDSYLPMGCLFVVYSLLFTTVPFHVTVRRRLPPSRCYDATTCSVRRYAIPPACDAYLFGNLPTLFLPITLESEGWFWLPCIHHLTFLHTTLSPCGSVPFGVLHSPLEIPPTPFCLFSFDLHSVPVSILPFCSISFHSLPFYRSSTFYVRLISTVPLRCSVSSPRFTTISTPLFPSTVCLKFPAFI